MYFGFNDDFLAHLHYINNHLVKLPWNDPVIISLWLTLDYFILAEKFTDWEISEPACQSVGKLKETLTFFLCL